MELLTKKPRGTEDKLPKEIYKWHTVEKIARNVAEAYGCKEIRTPTFEHTELFQRGVGGTTDVVQKEMYTFNDKKGRKLREGGCLADIAPTLIELMGLTQPAEMTGKSLLIG